MKKVKKIISSMAMTSLIIFSQSMSALASENVMAPYEEKLEQINQELGTDFKFNTEGELSKSEMEQFYTSMSVDQFDQYIRDAIREAEDNHLDSSTTVVHDKNSEFSLMESRTQQKYIYDTVHYIFVDVSINTEHGVTTYTDYHGAGDNGSQNSYPYYSLSSYVASFSDNKKVLNCNFSCIKYIAPNVSNTYTTPILVYFTAGGGDVSPTA